MQLPTCLIYLTNFWRKISTDINTTIGTLILCPLLCGPLHRCVLHRVTHTRNCLSWKSHLVLLSMVRLLNRSEELGKVIPSLQSRIKARVSPTKKKTRYKIKDIKNDQQQTFDQLEADTKCKPSGITSISINTPSDTFEGRVRFRCHFFVNGRQKIQ